jgi:hypothetical protein
MLSFVKGVAAGVGTVAGAFLLWAAYYRSLWHGQYARPTR